MESDLQKYLAPVADDLSVQAREASTAQMAIESELQQARVDWGRVERQARTGLEKARSLHLGIALVACLARTRGPAGLRDGLELLRRWTAELWPRLLPELDLEETDPKEQALRRLRLFKAIGSSNPDDRFRVQSHLLDMPVFPDASFSFRVLPVADGGGGDWPENRLAEAWAGALARDPDALATTEPALEGCLAELQGLAQALAGNLGGDPGFLSPAGPTPSNPAPWDKLRGQLEGFQRRVRLLSHGGATGVPEAPVPGEVAKPGAASPPVAFNTRTGAVQALRQAAGYFERTEPTSPVLFLLRYAVAVANRPFLILFKEWAPKEWEKVKSDLGLNEKSEIPDEKPILDSALLQADPSSEEALPPIENREEALNNMRAVASYFEVHDRSNPIPTILNQALELSGLSFGEIWARYAPEQLKEIQHAFGVPKPPTKDSSS